MESNAPLTLYTNPMSRGRIARWMIEEVGVEYETVILDLGSKIVDPAYLSLNPMGKVPTLVHGDAVVTEAAAICAYLADAFPEARLAPPVAERAAYYRWLFFGAGCLDPGAINHALGVASTPEQEGMLGYRSLAATFDALEWRLGQSRYLAGDAFTAADVYVGQQLNWGIQMQIVKDRPILEDYVGNLRQRPANQRAAQLDDDLIAAASHKG